MNKVKAFLKRKDIEFSAKRYFQDALSAMALGLFASLLIGLIIKTLGEQVAIWIAPGAFSEFCIETGKAAMALMGPAIGVAVAWGLKSPFCQRNYWQYGCKRGCNRVWIYCFRRPGRGVSGSGDRCGIWKSGIKGNKG